MFSFLFRVKTFKKIVYSINMIKKIDEKVFSHVELKVYNYINSSDFDYTKITVDNISRGAYVSQSTVMRALKKMGFSKVSDFKAAYIYNTGKNESLFKNILNESDDNINHIYLKEFISNLVETNCLYIIEDDCVGCKLLVDCLNYLGFEVCLSKKIVNFDKTTTSTILNLNTEKDIKNDNVFNYSSFIVIGSYRVNNSMDLINYNFEQIAVFKLIIKMIIDLKKSK